MMNLLRATQEQADNHTLVHWPEKECVSIVPITNTVGPPVFSKAGQVQVGKKIYEGMIIKIPNR